MSWVYFYPERRNAFLSDFLGFFCSPKKNCIGTHPCLPSRVRFYFVKPLCKKNRSLLCCASSCTKKSSAPLIYLQKIVGFVSWFLTASACFFFIPSKNLPVVHETINHWVVHGVGHSKPIDCQVDFLKKILKIYLKISLQNVFLSKIFEKWKIICGWGKENMGSMFRS